MAKQEPIRVVIEHTDNEIKTVTSEHPLDVIVVDYGNESLKDAVRDAGSAEELPVIPNDLTDMADGESAGVFEVADVAVDKEYVDDVHSYTQDTAKVSNYARTVLALFENNGAEIDDE